MESSFTVLEETFEKLKKTIADKLEDAAQFVEDEAKDRCTS